MYQQHREQRPVVEQVSIVPASVSEIEAVYGILNQATTWLATNGMQHWNGVHTRERILADFEKSHVLLAMLGDQGAVGTVTISFATPFYHQPSDQQFWADSAAPAAYIRKLAILPAYMKNGIAARLLAAAE